MVRWLSVCRVYTVWTVPGFEGFCRFFKGYRGCRLQEFRGVVSDQV